MKRQQYKDRLRRKDNDLSTLASYYDGHQPIISGGGPQRKSVKELVQAIEDKVKQDRQRRARRAQTPNHPSTSVLNESSHRPKKKMRVLPIELKDRPRLIFLSTHQLSQSSSSILSI